MNFESIKSKFIDYMLQDLKSDPKNENLTAEDISIFKYSDEFKEFVADEYNIDESELSGNISDILSMEFDELGKLVYPEDDNQENKGTNIITDFLNSMFSDSKMKEKIDADGDGKISDEEKENFLNTVGSMDEKNKNISFDDILKTMEKSEENKFEIKTPDKAEETVKTEDAGSTSSSGSSGSYGSSDGSFASSNNINKTNTEKSNIPDFSSMEDDEIKEYLDNAEKGINDGKTLANSLLSGTEDTYAKMKEEADELYQNYQDELKVLNEDMAKELDSHVENVADKEKARDEKLQQVLDQSIALADAETTYAECQETTKTTEETLSNLESSLSSLEGSLAGADEESKPGIQAQISAIKAQIETTKQELEAAKKAEEEAQVAVTKAEEKLKTLDEEATKATEEVQKAQEEKTTFEQEIAEKYPQIQEVQKNYNDCKNNCENYKATEFSKAIQSISDNQDIKNAAKIEIKKRENAEHQKEAEKDITPDNEKKAEEMIEYAKSLTGLREKDIEEIFGKNVLNGAWCADFVKCIAEKYFGDDLPEWYKNDNNMYCGRIASLAKENNATVDISEARAGDLIVWSGHICFVASVDDDGTIHTIEGNINGGQVAEREFTKGQLGGTTIVRISENPKEEEEKEEENI